MTNDMFEKQLFPGDSNTSPSSSAQSGDDQESGSNAVPKNGDDRVPKDNSWIARCSRGHMCLNAVRMVKYIEVN